MSQTLSIRGVRKRFGDTLVLAGIDIEVAASEVIAIVGPSGCGKSTLLRMIGGLDTQYEGDVRVGETIVRDPNPNIGMVFQEPRLFPWLTVADNVAFGLADRGHQRSRELVTETLGVLGLADFADSYPKHLSGGMAQRAALARALVTTPQVLLLDEPFSALDAFTRMRLQDHLLFAWSRYRPTLVLVTHDLDEAVYLADRVLLLSERPSGVRQVFEVSQPRPRDRTAPAFAELRARLLQALHLDRSDFVAAS